jgi:hypothetical protein
MGLDRDPRPFPRSIPAMAPTLFCQPSLRSGLIRSGLLVVLAPICSLSAGQAMAATFTRDPAADAWTKVGNSKTQGTANFGGWAANTANADFDIYSTSFLLSATDSVSAPTSGVARGDAYLYSSVLDGTANNKWNVGDKIVGLGVKFINGQAGSAVSGMSIFLNFEPNPQVGTAFVSGTLNTLIPGQWDFFAVNGQNGASAGSLNFNVVTSPTVQNQGPFGDTYSVKTAPGGSTTNNAPYGSIAGNGNNISTSGSSPQGRAPMRVFGNYIAGSPNTWTSYQIFLNESLMTRNGYGEAAFTSNALWSVTTSNSQNQFTTATGPMLLGGSGPSPSSQVPGPLPLLGAGAAFGWSRRLRRQLRATAGGLKITT